MLTYYQLFNLPRNATQEQINHAARAMLKFLHPDANPGNKIAQHLTQLVNEGHETLGEGARRNLYDTTLPAIDPSQSLKDIAAARAAQDEAYKWAECFSKRRRPISQKYNLMSCFNFNWAAFPGVYAFNRKPTPYLVILPTSVAIGLAIAVFNMPGEMSFLSRMSSALVAGGGTAAGLFVADCMRPAVKTAGMAFSNAAGKIYAVCAMRKATPHQQTRMVASFTKVGGALAALATLAALTTEGYHLGKQIGVQDVAGYAQKNRSYLYPYARDLTLKIF